MPLFDLGFRFRKLPFAAMLLLLGACFLAGGASRLDVIGLLIVQPLATICLAVFFCTAETIRWETIKVPLLLLAALVVVTAVQLIPLPPAIWTSLPGRAPFAQSDIVAGIAHPWRPISLTPDLTLASLVSLSVPLAVLVGFASITIQQTRRLLPFVIGFVMLSALIGLFQLISGGRSTLYFYRVTNFGSAVGVFANRNHQALMLAMAWPMLAVWASTPAEGARFAARRWIALALAIFLLPMVMATGSRAGIVLGGLALAAGALLWWRHAHAAGRRGWILPAIASLIGAAVIAAAVVLSRDEALQRLTGMDPTEESRLQFVPTIWRMVRDFFPVGSGFGSFDPVYRAYEPLELLEPTYLNHAHNDLLEIVLVGGLPAALIVAASLVWFASRAAPLVFAKGKQSLAFARLGAVMLLLLLVSSVVDYPLRTPLMAALACLACGWLADHSVSTGVAEVPSRSPQKPLRAT